MKKLVPFILFFLLYHPFVQAQWRQSLTGQSSLINNLSVVNDQVVWALSQKGTFVSLSTDGGASWTEKPFSAEMLAGSVAGLCAISASIAYAVVCNVNAGVYKTTDGGNTWIRQAGLFNSSASCADFIYFWNENDGVAVGDPIDSRLEIYVTTNGGGQWNRISVSDSPMCNMNEYPCYITNTVYRVLGNSICFYSNQGRLFRSLDKGLTWNSIQTPFTNGMNMSFAFKDDNNGLCCNMLPSNGTCQLYATSNGGVSWYSIDDVTGVNYLYYSPVHNAYFSVSTLHGLMYSNNDGASWNTHPSLIDVGLRSMSFMPSGKIFAGGWRYMFSSTNYQKQNISVTDAQLTSNDIISVTFSEEPDPVTSQEIYNYSVAYLQNGLNAINIIAATQDQLDKKVVHLHLASAVPQDTIKVYVYDVNDVNGNAGCSIINASPTSVRTIYNLPAAVGCVPSAVDVYWNTASRCLVFTGNAQSGQVEVVDLNGHVWLTEQLTSNEIPLNWLAPGYYLLKWRNESSAIVRKFVVK